MVSNRTSFRLIACLALCAAAHAGTLTGSFATTSVTTGTQTWASGLAANGVAGTSVTAFSTKSYDITANLNGGSNAVTDWLILDNVSPDYVYTRMAAGNGSIGPITRVVNTTDYPSYTEISPVATLPEANADRFTWTGGKAVASGTAVASLNDRMFSNSGTANTGVRGNGWTFTLPADTSTQHLRIYAGSYEAWGLLTATLGDGSAAPLNIGWGVDHASYGTNWVADIVFAANSNTTLTVSMIMNQDQGNWDGVWLSAIATTAIPEPGSLALLGIALGALLLFRRRK